jgi:hypothetical protein
MATKKQIAANRRNAKKSRGPKTAEGMAISAANAVKYGVLCQRFFTLPWEDPGEFAAMRVDLFEQLQPEGPMEWFLADRIAKLMWRLRRAEVWESAILIYRAAELSGRGPNRYFKPVVENCLPDTGSHEAAPIPETDELIGKSLQPRIGNLGQAYVVDVHEGETLSKVRRHETSLENSLRRALQELERLQDRRKALDDRAKSATDGHLRAAEKTLAEGLEPGKAA